MADIKHTIVIPVLVIFFKQVADENNPELKKLRFDEFESALRAIVAFTVLWRSSRQGTAGIDNEYRELLNKTEETTNFKPISVNATKGEVVDINSLKAELRSRLQSVDRKGKLENKEIYVQSAYLRPIYEIPKIAKLLLLASHHNCIDNNDDSGLLVKAKDSVNPCLTIDEYLDDKNLSLEHIAPQSGKAWDDSLYQAPDTIHTLGNLTLVSHQLNSALSNRMWAEKRIFYRVIGSKTTEEAGMILSESAERHGISFREQSTDILAAQKYMPNLIALGNYDKPFTKEFVEERSKQLYSLAWDELIQWLS